MTSDCHTSRIKVRHTSHMLPIINSVFPKQINQHKDEIRENKSVLATVAPLFQVPGLMVSRHHLKQEILLPGCHLQR